MAERRVFRAKSPEDLDRVAAFVAEREKGCAAIALYGPLGCGKTEWTRRFLRLHGIAQPVVSPTFTYRESYHCDANGMDYHHFDLYRISSEEEFFLIGGEEALTSDNVLCIIEWPELVEAVLPDSVISISFALDGDDRVVTVNVP